jgi:hypothetical protein
MRVGGGKPQRFSWKFREVGPCNRSSAYQRQDPHRAAGAAFQLCRGDYDHSAGRRGAIQVGDVFQLVDAMRQRVLAYGEVFRRAVVNVQRVDTQT